MSGQRFTESVHYRTITTRFLNLTGQQVTTIYGWVFQTWERFLYIFPSVTLVFRHLIITHSVAVKDIRLYQLKFMLISAQIIKPLHSHPYLQENYVINKRAGNSYIHISQISSLLPQDISHEALVHPMLFLGPRNLDLVLRGLCSLKP